MIQHITSKHCKKGRQSILDKNLGEEKKNKYNEKHQHTSPEDRNIWQVILLPIMQKRHLHNR